MATAIHIPLAEYLETSYSPDREYIDGEIRERNVGKWEHARMQWLLAVWFGSHEKEWGIVGSVGQRVLAALSRVPFPTSSCLPPEPAGCADRRTPARH